MEYKFPHQTPQEIRSFLPPIVSHIHSILNDSLVGIYLHGSLAMDSFQPGISDIDLIFIVKKHLSSEQKSRIIGYLKKPEKKKSQLN